MLAAQELPPFVALVRYWLVSHVCDATNRLYVFYVVDYCLLPASFSTNSNIQLIPAVRTVRSKNCVIFVSPSSVDMCQNFDRFVRFDIYASQLTVSLCGNKSLCMRKKFFPNCLNPLINFFVSSSVHFLSIPFGTGHLTSACKALPGS